MLPMSNVSREPRTLLIELQRILESKQTDAFRSLGCALRRKEGADRLKRKYIPSEECKECKSRIQRRVRIRTRRRIELTTSPQTIQGIEQTGAHEANESEQPYLDDRAVVDTLDAPS